MCSARGKAARQPEGGINPALARNLFNHTAKKGALTPGVAIRLRGTRGMPPTGLPREMPEMGAPKGRPHTQKTGRQRGILFEPFLTLFGAPRRCAP